MVWTGATLRALLGRWGRLGLIVAVVYLSGLVYFFVLVPVAGVPSEPAMGSMLLLSMLAVINTWRAGGIRQLDRASRRAWRLVATGLTLMVGSLVLYAAVPHDGGFPVLSDYGRFASNVTLLVALHCFPLRESSRRERAKLTVDAAVVLACGAMIVWYFVISPNTRTSGAVLAGGLFPVVDLVLVFAAVRLQLRGAGPGIRRSARLMTTAMLSITVIDTVASYLQAESLGHPRENPVMFAAVLTNFLLFSAAALEQRRNLGDDPEPARRRTGGISRLPFAAVLLSCALMSIATIRDQGLSREGGLILVGTAVTLLVLLRQLITQQENHAMATTDALTGVANRARIDEVLARTLELSARNGRHTAVLLADLNGFKAVNDTLGHKAGDALLIEFAALLRRSVLGADFVGRLGGDEFVVILDGDHGGKHVKAVEQRITDAMAEPILIAGTMVQPSASLGTAVCAPGELRPDDLLHRADMAMYNNKRARNSAAESKLAHPQPEPELMTWP